MSSPSSSKCSQRLIVASSSSSRAAATMKGERVHDKVLDVAESSTSADIQSSHRLLARKGQISEDRISRLPDDILVNIISRLTLAEAASTSVLSTRWKYLWTFITVLNFDGSHMLMNVVDEETLEDERIRFVNWVNNVLQSHRGLSINEFKVSFDLNASHESDITNWIYTAVLKGVQKLELNFQSVLYISLSSIFTFSQECYDCLTTPRLLSSLKSLRSLCLNTVNVTGEILELFIYNCPYLEKLDVAYTFSLLSLKIVGPTLRLKYLHICNYVELEELEISCPSLLSFGYFGPIIKYSIMNVPCLVDVSISMHFRGSGVGRAFGPIESYFPQLENLKLKVELNEENQFPKCELPALRHLTFEVLAIFCDNLLDLTCMMKTCPFLRKLTLTLKRMSYDTEVRSRQQYPELSHQHLKVVELIGFSGNPVELELAHYLLENTTKLEELHLRPWRLVSEADVEVAREQAKHLEEVVPPGVSVLFELL